MVRLVAKGWDLRFSPFPFIKLQKISKPPEGLRLRLPYLRYKIIDSFVRSLQGRCYNEHNGNDGLGSRIMNSALTDN